MSNEHLNNLDLTMCISKYLISVIQGKSFPVKLTISAQLISQRGPMRIQQCHTMSPNLYWCHGMRHLVLDFSFGQRRT